jgi:hypothetical protein
VKTNPKGKEMKVFIQELRQIDKTEILSSHTCHVDILKPFVSKIVVEEQI